MIDPASVIGFWITYAVQQNLPSNSNQWVIPFAIQIIPAGLLIICMTFMTESPRWLMKKGKYEAARKNLSWVRNLPSDHEYIETELAEMKAQLDHEAETIGHGVSGMKTAWREIISKKMRFRVLFAMAMKWMSNLTGCVALIPPYLTYSPFYESKD